MRTRVYSSGPASPGLKPDKHDTKALTSAGAFLLASAVAGILWLAHTQTSHAHRPKTPPLIVVAGPKDGPLAPLTLAVKNGVEAALAACRSDPEQRRLTTPTACPTLAMMDVGCGSDIVQTEAFDRAIIDIVKRRPIMVLGFPCDTAARQAAKFFAEADVPFIAVGLRSETSIYSDPAQLIFKMGADRSRDMHALLEADRYT
ncbi:MAG: hypothetical protein AAFO75_12455, partial [Pseudomonadota bacterium]